MRAVVITGGQLESTTVPDPTPNAGDVVVAVERCGICGTDLHLVDGGGAEGLIPGHEIAGEVVAIGSGVDGPRPGTKVAVKPNIPCGHCGPCRREMPNACDNQWTTHLGLTLNGGYAEYVRAPAKNVIKLPAGVSPADAALAEPYAVAMHGVSLAPLPPDTEAMILGAGPLGLMITRLLLQRGADVVVVEPRPARAAAAAALGARRTYSSAGEFEAAEEQASVIFECSGATGMVSEAVRLVRTRGSVIMMASSHGPLTVDARSWLRKEVTVQPSVAYSMTDFRAGLRAVEEGAVTPAMFATQERGLDEAQAAVVSLRAGELVKVQLDPARSMTAAAAGAAEAVDA